MKRAGVILNAAALLAAVALGYGWGRSEMIRKQAAEAEISVPIAPADSAGADETDRPRRGSLSGGSKSFDRAQWNLKKQRMLAMAGSTELLRNNWTLRFQLRSMMHDVPLDELEAFRRELPLDPDPQRLYPAEFLNGLLLEEMGPRGGAALAARLNAYPEGSSEYKCGAMMLHYWAMAEPDAALAWLDGRSPADAQLDYNYADALRFLGSQDVAALGKRLGAMPVDRRVGALKDLIADQAESGIRENFAGLCAGMSVEQEQEIERRLLSCEGVRDPVAAREALGQSSLPEEVRTSLAAEFVAGEIDLPGTSDEACRSLAIGWLEKERRGLTKQASHVLGSWCQRDPEAVVRWIDSLPNGAERDEMLAGASWGLVFDRDNAQQAIAFAAAIGSDSIRQSANGTLKLFMHGDLEAWKATLSPEDRAALK